MCSLVSVIVKHLDQCKNKTTRKQNRRYKAYLQRTCVFLTAATTPEATTARLSLSAATTTKKVSKHTKSNMTHLRQGCCLRNHCGSSQPVAATATSPTPQQNKGMTNKKSQSVRACVRARVFVRYCERTSGFDSAGSLLAAAQNRHKLYASMLFTRPPRCRFGLQRHLLHAG